MVAVCAACCAYTLTQRCALHLVRCVMLYVQAIKLGDVGVVRQLLALVPRDIDGGVGEVQTSSLVLHAFIQAL